MQACNLREIQAKVTTEGMGANTTSFPSFKIKF